MVNDKKEVYEIRKVILDSKRIVQEIEALENIIKNTSDKNEKQMILSQIKLLKNSLKEKNDSLPIMLNKIVLTQPIPKSSTIKETPIQKASAPKNNPPVKRAPKTILPKHSSELEKRSLERFKKTEEKKKEVKVEKPSSYIKFANVLFFKFSNRISQKKIFTPLKNSLPKANIRLVLPSYISVIFLTTAISVIAGILLFSFFLFFNFGPKLPIITPATESFNLRLLKTFWILLAVPIGTFVFTYFYPSMERKAIESRINRELPFVTVHMSAISGSMIEPSKIFSIINFTKEYPHVSMEFTKLLNEINIYGYDLVSALRRRAFNGPSGKLSELFNGLAAVIVSGGDLQDFFEKRAQSLLFEYKIENEKRTKTSETFMDIYISVVIASPMIFMLVLMMMKISGLGISLSTSMISLIMVLGVGIINIIFLTFLHFKQPSE